MISNFFVDIHLLWLQVEESPGVQRYNIYGRRGSGQSLQLDVAAAAAVDDHVNVDEPQ